MYLLLLASFVANTSLTGVAQMPMTPNSHLASKPFMERIPFFLKILIMIVMVSSSNGETIVCAYQY
jgi:hypothetical protein